MELAKLRILVVNDDGIQAPGLAILEQALRPYCDDAWVLAPATNQSGKARATSYGAKVRLKKLVSRRYEVHGTPADCTLVGLNGLGRERPFDLVLSGVNDGANVADDVAASGTIGACLQAAAQNVPSVAISQHWGPGNTPNWFCSEAMLSDLLPGLIAAAMRLSGVLNVNFPAINDRSQFAGVAVVPAGRRVGPINLQSCNDGDDDWFLVGDLRADLPDTDTCDLAALMKNYLTVTPLTLDQSDYAKFDQVREQFASFAVAR